MVAKRAEKNGRPSWEELSPAVRDAVQRVLNDPIPEELTRCAVEAVRRQAAKYPRKSKSRIMAWAAPAVAAAIALIVLADCFRAIQSDNGLSGTLPPRTPRAGVAAAFSEDLPTVWAYSRAARQSPEVLYARMDRHASRSISSKDVSPLLPNHAGTAP